MNNKIADDDTDNDNNNDVDHDDNDENDYEKWNLYIVICNISWIP